MWRRGVKKLFFLKAFFGLLILLAIIFSNINTGRSQTAITTQTSPSPSVTNPTHGDILQPSPQIIHPQKDSKLAGNVVIEIFINATVILEMNVYASESSTKSIYLGMAEQTQGTYYQLWWDTNSVANGNYLLYASAKLSNSIKTYSGKIPILVNNQIQSSTQASAAFQNSPGQVETDQGLETQIQKSNQTNLITQAPQTAVSVATPPPAINFISIPDLLKNSELVTTIGFRLDQDKTLHLEKIECRINNQNQRFLVFSGHSYPLAKTTITINSQPLVLSAEADNTGNWTYILENPLEPDKHETFVEVNINEKIEKSGPYPFTIAKAQATADNPTGASLELVNPQKQALEIYLLAAGGLVGVAILILAIYFYIKQVRKKAQNLAKESQIAS